MFRLHGWMAVALLQKSMPWLLIDVQLLHDCLAGDASLAATDRHEMPFMALLLPAALRSAATWRCAARVIPRNTSHPSDATTTQLSDYQQSPRPPCRHTRDVPNCSSCS
jgi:hypothetical protein